MIRFQPKQLEVSPLDLTADFVPLIFFFHPLARGSSSRLSNCGVGDQEAETIAEISYVAGMKGKSCSFHCLAIFRHIAGKNAQFRSHRIQQRQRETLHIGWKDEDHRIAQQFIKIFACDPAHDADSVVGVFQQFSLIVIAITRAPRHDELDVTLDTLEGLHQ